MHPPLYPFVSAKRWIDFGGKILRWNEEELFAAEVLLSQKMIPILRGSELGLFLGISGRLVTRASAKPEFYYKTFRIPKKSGGCRVITAPRVYLKVVQRYILDCILSRGRLPKNVVGFVRGRSMRDGADIHRGARFLWNIDLQDFFPSVEMQKVVSVFEGFGYPKCAAEFLARLCCYKGCLPQGAPTSPMLANLVFAPLDEEILTLSEQNSISYSRYADDLSFSGDKVMPVGFMASVIALIENSGFLINPKKSRLVGPSCRREVTGLVVNENISVPRDVRRKIRAMVHRFESSGGGGEYSYEAIVGYISYIHNYHPLEAKVYWDKIRRYEP